MTVLSSNSIETLANRIRGVPSNGTLRFISHPQADIILEIAKMFIDTDYFAEEGIEIEFTNDYKSIRKKERFNYEKELEKIKLKNDSTRTAKTNT